MRWGCGWAWIGWPLFFRDVLLSHQTVILSPLDFFLTLSPQSLWIPNKQNIAPSKRASVLWLFDWFFFPVFLSAWVLRACFHFSPGELVVLWDYENSSTVSLKTLQGKLSSYKKQTDHPCHFHFHTSVVCAACMRCLCAVSSHLPAAIGYSKGTKFTNSISNKMRKSKKIMKGKGGHSH